MKEFVIDVTGIDRKLIDICRKKFAKVLNDKKGAFTELELNGNYYFLLATDKQSEIKQEVKILFCDVVREQFKTRFIANNLKLKDKKGEKFDLLVRVLSCFDREYDDKKINEIFSFDSYICIYSLFYFKFSCLKNKWREVVQLANASSEFFIFNDAFYEFVRFIISCLEFQKESLFLIEEGEAYCIFSEQELLAKVDKNNELDLLTQIITFNPRRINVSSLSKKIAGLLISLFDSRVEFV